LTDSDRSRRWQDEVLNRLGLTEDTLKVLDEIDADEAASWMDSEDEYDSPQSGQDRLKAANEKRRETRDRRAVRAIQLKANGLSATQIGIRIAADEGRAEPYPERRVRIWLALKRDDPTM
jgi:hypothetical protein